ncbi:hypothetical protein GQ55_5G213300 [Panicum hallii var. hallii]|uniref:Uncharacterized protein n=1 Tax=Panicum hallii var. hallii TaxID=1504633 RepID=A0A2T7DIQ5_9POAL|nr:hypothetical protein GQ55_5G213300 [Panicum hallii var. hallii]
MQFVRGIMMAAISFPTTAIRQWSDELSTGIPSVHAGVRVSGQTRRRIASVISAC